MEVAIIGYKEEDYAKLQEEMEYIVTHYENYMFYVLCGRRGSVAEKWANEVGLPAHYLKNPNNPIQEICRRADFLVCCDNGSEGIKKLLQEYKKTGHHGRVWRKV